MAGDLSGKTRDEIHKKINDLKSFSQQRSHLSHTAIPDNSVGIVGEVRYVDTGAAWKIIVKTSKGWKSVAIT